MGDSFDVEVNSSKASNADKKKHACQFDEGCDTMRGDVKASHVVQGSVVEDVEATSIEDSSATGREHVFELNRDQKAIGEDEEALHPYEEPADETDATSVKELFAVEKMLEYSVSCKTNRGDDESPLLFEELTHCPNTSSVRESFTDEKDCELEQCGDQKVIDGCEELYPLEEPMDNMDATPVKESSTDKTDHGNEQYEDQKPIISHDKTPQVGMLFKSYEEAMDFYNEYAHRVGFNTKIRSSSYGEDGQCKTFKLACCKSGKGPSNATKYYLSRPLAKTNCMARISAKLCGDGWFRLMDVNLEHNHPLVAVTSQYGRSNRKKSRAAVKGHIESEKVVTHRNKLPTRATTFVLQPQDYENLSLGEIECKSCVKTLSTLKLREGDIEAIHQYFLAMQTKTSNFFYLMDLNEKGHLRNVFWADGRSRTAYQYFSDVVLFDTTYLARKYDVPFASFVGVNHHGQLVLLGCALLSNDSIETYKWLLKAWLSCMSRCSPNAIITDESEAMRIAIADVFPRSRHRLCLWQIISKMPEKLGGFAEYKDIKKTLKKAVYDCLGVHEFEEEWKNMIQKYGLTHNEWLKLLFESRHSWVPVFIKDSFWAGMSLTQRGETMHSFFDGYIHSESSLKQLLSNYEMVLRSKYEKEAHADFDSFHKIPHYVSQLYMEEQLCKIYTIDIFKKFQDEIKVLTSCQASLVRTNGLISTFEVKDNIKRKDGKRMEHKNYEVLYNAKELQVQCICHSYQYRGILCRHALSVLSFQDVDVIPSQYILKRWRKDFKSTHALPCSSSDAVANGPNEHYDNLCKHCLEIVDIGLISDVKYKLAVNLVGEVKEKLLLDNYAAPCSTIAGRPAGTKTIDPLQAKRKGYLPRKRKDLLVEKMSNTNKRKLSRSTPTSDDQTDVLPSFATAAHYDTHNGTWESIEEAPNSNATGLGMGRGEGIN